ncbi:hypothetical protein [Planktothrix pseudagardhii]|uniref:VWA domain-containing protein n=1 Tax=Planktothrix pseudagardhii TaxID=132604 RepID=A0A9W4CEM4_9CYAN|nr:hypothetical protein [Planktothrix pseudagardhii]CAD5917808.1 hypothetical protein NO713_00463 [Planktothrix pseudagardhii]
MNKPLFNLTIIALSLVVASCTTTITAPDPSKSFPESFPKSESQRSPSQPIDVSINIDGTASMLGFVTIPDSEYNQILGSIERATSSLSDKSSGKYYRFGIKKEPFQDNNGVIEAQSASFYNLYNSNLFETHLKTVIPNPHPANQLSIIVTDLYTDPQQSQINQILDPIKNNFNQNLNYAVGIMAFRSQFDGTIFDIGLGKQEKNYTTNSQDSKTFRPFYVLVLGDYSLVHKFFDFFQKDSSIKPQESVIFFPHPLEKPLFLNINDQDKSSLASGVQRNVNINNGTVQVTTKNRQLVERIVLTKDYQNEKMQWEIPYSLLPETLPLEFEFEPELKKYGQSSCENLPKIQVNQEKSDGTKLVISPDFSTLTEPGVYQLIINVKVKDFQTPKWWQDWSFEQPQDFKPNKTYKLSPLLSDLKDATVLKMPTQNKNSADVCQTVSETPDSNKNSGAIGQLVYIIQKD